MRFSHEWVDSSGVVRRVDTEIERLPEAKKAIFNPSAAQRKFIASKVNGGAKVAFAGAVRQPDGRLLTVLVVETPLETYRVKIDRDGKVYP